ncbi:MAG TPA: NBR1-Ig-like domain-containing protein [Promineifilum sp.]
MNLKSRKKSLVSLRWAIVATILGSAAFLVACSTGGPETATTPTSDAAAAPTATSASSEPARGQAVVNAIDVQILESFPVQVHVVATGELPDSCTEIDEVISQRTDQTFRVAVTTIRQPSQVCTQALVPFEEVIPLDVAGLEAGTYEVSVNGVTGSFTLAIDNVAEPAAGEGATTGAGAATSGEPGIGGSVWHDLCPLTGASTDDAPEEEGCVASPDGATVQADGVRSEDESGIPGVEVSLLAGDCTSASPGDDVVTTTDESGAFRFDGISAGTYCIFLDTVADTNAEILEEGILTFPTSNDVATNSITVELEEGAAVDDMNFGYDYRFLPLPEAATDCRNSFEFIQDLSVPDNTVFPPDAEFEAGWRLHNNGTCPWTTDYAIAFVGGDAMGITATVPLETAVSPGQTEDVFVTLTAPTAPGTYRSNWQLSDASGTVFGIDGVIEDSFWVQIIVEEGAPPVGTPAPGSSVVGGVVWEDICLVTNGNPSNGCVETEEGSGFYRGNGSYDANEAPLAGITVVIGSGPCPEGGGPAPADQIDSAITDEEGLYRFEGLDAGIFCVAIDALSTANVDLLIPGNWTWPAPGTGRQGIRIASGEERLTIDFGWEFQN